MYITETDKGFQTQGSTDKSFIYKDHLGSTDIITGRTGAVLQSMSFDAWGQRRDGQSWDLIRDVAKRAFDTDTTNRGFTGHEQLDEVGLIHMNGRVYDPKLGRFQQADPFIQAADNTQSYNRYSYVWNNPLNKDDPSGYFLKDLYKFEMKISGRWSTHKFLAREAPEAAAAVQVGLNFIPYFGQLASAHFAFDQSFFATRSFGSAAKSGLISYVSAQAFTAASGIDNVFVQGLVQGFIGGVSSDAQGGSFIDGFVAAGVTSFVKVDDLVPGDSGGASAGRVVAAAIVGGTASEITGGKFANGAGTAAFLYTLRALPNLYKNIVGYDLDVGPGGKSFEKGPTGDPIEGANNIGTQNVWEFDEDGKRIVGAFEEGGSLSKTANKIPGINATAGLHDIFQISMGNGLARDTFNVPGMVVAGGFTYAAFAGQPLQYLNDRQMLYLSVSASHDNDEDGRRYAQYDWMANL